MKLRKIILCATILVLTGVVPLMPGCYLLNWT